jgi:hypothetical protein
LLISLDLGNLASFLSEINYFRMKGGTVSFAH